MKKLTSYIKLARPHHYVKNGFVWMPIFFDHRLNDFHAAAKTFWVFVAFCLLASIVYILNDLIDIQEDREHPQKKNRPLASGALNRIEALLFFTLLFIIFISIFRAIFNKYLAIVFVSYLLLNLVYSFKLKNIAIIDIIFISIGFVLRVFAGGIASGVILSHWLVLIVFLLALFLALAKRRDDLLLLSYGHNSRICLVGYNLEFVSLTMVTMASVVIVSYILYTVSPEVINLHGTNKLYLTTLWVIVGFLRYMQITFVDKKSGSPTMIVLKDLFMQVVIILWLIHHFLLIYVFRET